MRFDYVNVVELAPGMVASCKIARPLTRKMDLIHHGVVITSFRPSPPPAGTTERVDSALMEGRMKHNYDHEPAEIVIDYDEDGDGTEMVRVCTGCGAHEALNETEERK